MATRSTISVCNPDGSVSKIYCHWDGYIENNGQILQTYYNSYEKVKELQTKGDMSSLGETPEDSEYYCDRGETDVKPKVYKSFEYYTTRCQFEEYNYLFKDGEWLVSEGENSNFVKLTDLVK